MAECSFREGGKKLLRVWAHVGTKGLARRAQDGPSPMASLPDADASLTSLSTTPPEPAALSAPAEVVRRYLEATAQRRALDDQLAWLRAELELVAAQALSEARPRGRFVAPGVAGSVLARVQPTCTFDRQAVSQELQRAGRLHEVAMLQGPALARFLAREPALAARLGDRIRYRRGVVLMAADL